MKKTFTLLALICLIGGAVAQSAEKCGTMELHRRQVQNPDVAGRYAAAQQAAAAWRANHASQRTTLDSLLTIPVVVHVLYKNANQNISMEQIQSQIRILNEDYRRQNADTVNTVAVFDSIAADIQVEFCLAALDPDGQPTDGVTRTSTTGGQLLGWFSPIFEDAKFDSTGGHDAWPADQYLNIWVCETFPGLLGYAQFPGGDPLTDGVVISYQAFGDMGTVTAPSTGGRTTCHEVGHWMGLFHIWGDDQDCTGSDSIFDTPNATVASSSDCQVGRNTCSNEDSYWGAYDPEDMVQNYMDYSHDTCMNMFSLGQKARMHSFLLTDPNRLALFTSPAGCNAPVVAIDRPSDDAIAVFPNPNQGRFTLRLGNSMVNGALLEVYDLRGALVGSMGIVAQETELDLSSHPAGCYLLKVSSAEGVTLRRVVIE